MTNFTYQLNTRAGRRRRLARVTPRLQERLGSAWRTHQWSLMAILWLCALWLAYAGLGAYMREAGRSASSLDIVYLALQLVTLESGAIAGPIPWQLEVARFALPTLAAWTAIRTLALVFRDQTQRVALRFMREHVVICGLSQMGLLLATRFLARKERVVLLVQDEGNPLIDTCRSKGAIVLIGDLLDQNLLQQAALQRARLLIAVSDDDGVNAGVAVQAQDLRGASRSRPLACILHVVEPCLYDLLRENEISNQQFPSLRLMLFNVYEHGARVMVEQTGPGGAIESSDGEPGRVLIVGMGNLGESVLLHIARLWFDENGQSSRRLRMDVIDGAAEKKCAALLVRYPHLSNACDIHPWTMQLEGPEYLQAQFLSIDSESRAPDAVFVCIDDDTLGLYAGLALDQKLRQAKTPIVIRMRRQSGLAMLLGREGVRQSPYSNMHAFDLFAQTCTPEILLGGTHERLAQAFYYEYVRQLYRSEQREKASQSPSWQQLSEQEREANRRQVDRMGAILDSAGYDLAPQRDWGTAPHQFSFEEIEHMARLEHERWSADLRRMGWRHAAGKKDERRKTHPLLVPWESLLDEEREKNRSPLRELPPLLMRVGYKLVKRMHPG